MATHNLLRPGHYTQHRHETGTPVTVDPATDATNPDRRALLNCRGYQGLVGTVKIAGGGTVTLQALAYDAEADELYELDTQGPLADGEAFTFDVAQLRTYLRISTLTGAPTDVEVLVAPTQPVGL